MPSKKKKYNARFPPARIKKIMQTDEDVGKVAAAVPVIISRSLELFIQSFMHKTAAITKGRNAKTLSAAHIKQTIHSEKTFDFLRDLVSNVPDHQPDEEGDSNASVPSGSSGPEVKKQKIQKPKKEKTGNGRGRPRKKSVVVEEKQETESEHDGDDDDDEETESDSSQTNTEQLEKPADSSVPHPFNMQAPPQSGPYSAESLSNSTSHMNPAFTSPPSLANLMPPSLPQQNPLSPRLPILQSPPELSNFPMMPPHPQLQNMPNQIPSPQQHFSGVTNQIPPNMFTNFSNQLPVRPNFYPTHSLNLQQYPNMNSQETFPNDQKLFKTSPVAPPFPQSQSHPQFKHETNPARSVMNSMQNNEPLDMSKASLIQRSPVIAQEVDPGKNKELPISLTGLSNIMNMTSSKPLTDDDDYDT